MSVRPRPRPKPRVAGSASAIDTSTTPKAGPSTAPGKSKEARELEVDDMFLKNRNRTALGWKQIEKRVQQAEAVRVITLDTSDSEVEGQAPPRSRKKGTKAKLLPGWTNPNVVKSLLRESEDEDGVDLYEADDATPRGNHQGKRKRRSRSRSITPPPSLTITQIQTARSLVRQALDAAPRPASPTLIRDDQTEPVELDPELAEIAAAVQQKSFGSARDTHLAADGEVTIKVKWIPHPQDEAGRSKLWSFKMFRSESFSELFENTADEAAVLTDTLVVIYDGSRVFAASTPQGLNIWTAAEFEACTKNTYDFIRDQALARSLVEVGERSLIQSRSPSVQPHESDAEYQASQEGEEEDRVKDTFKLTLRSGSTKNVTVTVRPTTRCSAIVATFLKKVGVMVDNASAMLVVDGDSLDPESEIGQADLEDGDMVDVTGL